MNKFENIASLVIAASLAGSGSGCDADGTEVEPEESLEARDLRGGCAYPAVAPNWEHAYFQNAGTSSGGCDLYVGGLSYYDPVGSRLFVFEAVSDKPFSEWSAVVWGRDCTGGCGPWTKYEASPELSSEETGYCDVAQQVPCIYKLTGYLLTPANPEYDDYRVGFSAFDEDGDPVFMRYHVSGE